MAISVLSLSRRHVLGDLYDRCEAITELGVPNISLAEYRAPENYPAAECPLCKAGTPITRF